LHSSGGLSGAHYTREIGSFGKNDDLLAFLQLGEKRFERSQRVDGSLLLITQGLITFFSSLSPPIPS
jgi:hypothetical protein